ncbi:MAG TPA: hypothetical protein VEJ86_04780, partial [Candidatus Binataceae bacterium]|nr:hypothetical protein [Candidatus Binataceae bacterium]
GPVRGGKIYGRWPGLGPDELYQQRDLAVTNDFRDVIGTVLASHMGSSQSDLNKVFPGRPRNPQGLDGIIRV